MTLSHWMMNSCNILAKSKWKSKFPYKRGIGGWKQTKFARTSPPNEGAGGYPPGN